MTNAPDQAYEIIRHAILDGTFQPGDRLIEEKLVEMCGVSRTPIREAIQRLVAENYLASKPNSGSFVAKWEQQDIDDIFALRATVESMACRRAASTITPEELIALRKEHNVINAALNADGPVNISAFLLGNRRFHEGILVATKSEPLIQAANRLISPPIVSRTAFNYNKEDIARSNDHHAELIEALGARDGDWSESIMRSHIRAAHHRFLETSHSIK